MTAAAREGIVSPRAVCARAQARLESLAGAPSEHPASGGYGTRLRRLGLRSAELYAAARNLARECRALDPHSVLRVAQRLVDSGIFEAGLLAFLLLERHRPAAESLGARNLERLAHDPDNWVTADSFACLLSGPAWRRGQVSDARIRAWARSRSRWWRRIALVSTVPLNLPSRGGTGDAPRTLLVCALLAADHDDMVAKAMSWALRVAAKRDPASVRAFLARHEAVLAARVLREVRNKLATGRKNPPPKPGRSRAPRLARASSPGPRSAR
jgi:3-methyladenine DNA glycosylase AlkD